MSDASVLVVEDEPSFAEALTLGLGREGFTVTVSSDGADALRRFDEVAPDIVLLDVMLPTLSGIDVCRAIRAKSNVPIIMVSAKGEELDMVVCLEVGADDYVTKPYRLRELVARMRAVMRRSDDGSDPIPGDPRAAQSNGPIVVGDVVVDTDRHEVRVRGEQILLPLKEFDLLTILIDNAGSVLAREMLIERVWGADYYGDTKTLDVHIKRLRSKIEPDAKDPTRIVTIRGLGYKYQD
ncbi:MAG: two-component system response regulator RegX3 [Verrucomicrobiales bacterium]|jgi:two-component system response regulator RegX3